MQGQDWVQSVTPSEAYEWTEGQWQFDPVALPPTHFHVVVIDFGTKHNILRSLRSRGCRVTVVPAQTSAEAILKYQPDGIMLSNGPGDPAAVSYGIKTVRELVEKQPQRKEEQTPIFWDLLRTPDFILSLGRQHLQTQVWAPWGESPC